ncbi:MAG TPA: hypothetical protein DDW94_10010 [Deltaproteobacteria bacterium]|nr:MAG: hypothetical protein A2Z79_12605 [Deltaproteobacteria bacterium GWA2_55_82]OGQ64008.1 MAG: hypothetical protein A3I81_08135 [Deltaproteobacteria bacterium RIFCSPLOWO2_02_FULL_55_12]OIJ73442.1 MAG: hypothetical protein A2V21_303675 [Deltaproteobacteria bacterium GWC2_55_46]HBG47305.1 hypothetical protein [Deltaproteobacteria bacterium]HCY10071.1 hypothetical protein [Deltaproteobacteria bacterium]
MRKILKYPAPADLSYFNARVRGLRGALLRGPDYEALLHAEGLDSVVDRLRSTGYGPDVELASAKSENKEEVLSNALRSRLSKTFELLWKIAPEGARPLLKAVFSVLEVFDLKTIIRGIARGVKRDDVGDVLIPAGELDTAALKMLLTSRDVPDLIRFLDTWGSPYSRPLKKGIPAFQRDGRITEMEIALDRQANESIMSTLGEGKGADAGIMRRWMSMRIDLMNILTLFKAVDEGYTAEGAGDFFVEGGIALRKGDFISMAGLNDRAGLLEALRKRVTDVWMRGALDNADPGDLGLTEEAFDDALQKRLSKLANVDPLSIALAASFIYKLAREAKNLRLIGLAKSFRMPDDEVRRLLIYPV